jgi:transcriptional regulator with XRE-family HTH domain
MFYREKEKEIRKSRKLSQNRLAEIIGKSPRAVWGWEKGEHEPSVSEIRDIAKALAVKTNDISSYEDIKTVTTFITDTASDKLNFDISRYDSDKQAHLISLKNDLVRMSDELKRLKYENNQYSLMFNRFQSFIYFKDSKLRFTEANAFFKNSFNIPNEELIGKDSKTIFGAEGEELETLERKVLESEVRLVNKKIFIPGSFKKRDGMLSIFPVTGNVIGKVKGLACSITDVTALSKAHTNMSLLENVINSFDHVVWIKSLRPVPHYLFVSNAASSVFGKSPDEFYNNSNIKWEIVHPDDRSKAYKMDYEFGTYPATRQYRIIMPDGSVKKIKDKIYRKKNFDESLILFGFTVNI